MATTKKPVVKLNEVQTRVAQALVAHKESGFAASLTEDRFPTRTLEALARHGLAKVKEKKNASGVKENFWFPTAATSKALTARV